MDEDTIELLGRVFKMEWSLTQQTQAPCERNADAIFADRHVEISELTSELMPSRPRGRAKNQAEKNRVTKPPRPTACQKA